MRTPFLLSLLHDQRGASMIEYAILIGVLGIGIAGSISMLEEKLSAAFDPASSAYRQVQCERLLADSDYTTRRAFEKLEADEEAGFCELLEASQE